MIGRWLGRGKGSTASDAVASAAASPVQSGVGSGYLVRVPGDVAREAHKHNAECAWASTTLQANKADATLASNRIWAPYPALGIRPKFNIDPQEPVFAMGSCFAREVEEALTALGFDVPTHCDGLFDDPTLAKQGGNAGGRARGFLNRYNSMSMLDEVRHLLGLEPEIEQGLMTYQINPENSADLHYSQSLHQVNQAATLERRRLVRNHLGPALRRSRLFVLTLGMAECWFDNQAGRYLNNTPGPRVLATRSDQLEIRLTTFNQHLSALHSLHATLAEALGPDFKIVITVSPVALQRTYLQQDIVATNCYSKSMLRAVAQEFAMAYPNVDYFPSYEIVSYADPKCSWMWDYRHVNQALVAHVMKLFHQHYAT